MILLLCVEVAELPLPLSCHPPFRLHHLLCFVGAARGLLALGVVEGLEVRVGMAAAAGIVEMVHGVGARAGGGRDTSGYNGNEVSG